MHFSVMFYHLGDHFLFATHPNQTRDVRPNSAVFVRTVDSSHRPERALQKSAAPVTSDPIKLCKIKGIKRCVWIVWICVDDLILPSFIIQHLHMMFFVVCLSFLDASPNRESSQACPVRFDLDIL